MNLAVGMDRKIISIERDADCAGFFLMLVSMMLMLVGRKHHLRPQH